LARHNPRCALCGAPTRPQVVGGVNSLVCVACGAATVDQRALEKLVGTTAATPTPPPPLTRTTPTPAPTSSLPPFDDEPVFDPDGIAALSDIEFEQQLHTLRAQRRRQVLLMVGLGAMGLLFLLAVPVALLGLGALGWTVQGTELPEPIALPEGPSDAPVPAPPTPDPAEPPAATDAEPEGNEPPAPPEPEPEPPEPESAPAPVEPAPAPQASPVRSYIKQGWSVASRDPARGAEAFRKALELRPGHDEATYGLGYCLLKLDQKPAAAVHLCDARNTPDAEIRRDVAALLANNGLTCSP